MKMKPAVLIVATPGDLQTSLQMLLALLSEVEVLVAAEGSSALQAVEHYAPALVILDFELPGTVGPKVLIDIKSCRPATPCLALVNDEQQLQRAKDAGADRAVIKGYPPAKLLANIEDLLFHGETGHRGEQNSRTETKSNEIS